MAAVNVNENNLEKLKSELGASNEDDLKKKIISLFDKERKSNNLNSLEGIKDVYVDTKNW